MMRACGFTIEKYGNMAKIYFVKHERRRSGVKVRKGDRERERERGEPNFPARCSPAWSMTIE